MHRSAKKWALAVTLTGLMQLAIVCDTRELERFFDDLGVEVYYDDCHCGSWDCYQFGYWSDCDDEWSFDFDWW
jgi:hypothetical protein